MWTCIICKNGYDSITGSTDERICNECLDAPDKKYDEIEIYWDEVWE
tara:strand:+ start:710 stop:850 length:141 start_codon:yes stop_codon:yes gene_type:complete